MSKPRPKMLPKDTNPVCWRCDLPVTECDYCYGCETFICEDCDVEIEQRPDGIHAKEAHLVQ